MKLFLDTCVWGKAKQALVERGYDVVWSGDWDEDPGDEQILAHAASESRVLVTLDKDFGELAVVRGVRHTGIVRLVGIRTVEQAEWCIRVIQKYGQELSLGALVTVEPARIRIRASEIEKE